MRSTLPPLSVSLSAVVAVLACGAGDLMLPGNSRPVAMAVLTGNNQAGEAGQPLADSLVVRVSDSLSRPVAQLRVAFLVTAGGGTVAPDTTVTDNNGRAAALWTLGPTAGAQAVEALVVGSDMVQATFAATSAGSGLALTTTQITSVSPEPSFPTQLVTVHFTVTSTVGVPVGTVTVTNSTVSCTAQVADGQCGLAPTTAGAETLTAAYQGSATFAPSSGTAPHQVVLAGTSTTLSSSPNPSVKDQSVKFTAIVTSGFTTPSGSVQFVEGSCGAPTQVWSTKSLDSSGQASFSTKALSVGTHLMLACYLGTGTFAPSASQVLQQQVIDEQRK